MYNVRLPDKVENDYKSLVGRIISCKLYPRLSLQPWVSQCTRGTSPTESVSRHPKQGTEPYLSLDPPRSRRQCLQGAWARGPGGPEDTGFVVLDFRTSGHFRFKSNLEDCLLKALNLLNLQLLTLRQQQVNAIRNVVENKKWPEVLKSRTSNRVSPDRPGPRAQAPRKLWGREWLHRRCIWR